MFAVILQESSPYGIKQYAVIPQPDGTVRELMREGKNLRGTAGAWGPKPEFHMMTGMLVGEPVAIQITTADYRDLQYPITPTTLVQKLVRTVKDENTVGVKNFEAVYSQVLQTAQDNPVLLGVYLSTSPQPQPVTVSPTIQVVQQPVLSEASVEYVELPFVPEYQPLEESESPMQYSTVAPSLSDSHAVLTVPDAELYVSRKFYGNTEEEIYDTARANGWNVLLTGDAGTGKTSSARNYAAQHSLPFVTIECTQQIDQSITQGRFVPTGVGNSTQWKYSQLATAIQQPSVILINELTRMTPKAASLFLRLLQERELLIEPMNEVIKVHPGVLFIADQNTGLGYTGTSKQDAALVDRFNIKLEFHYDKDIESKFIPSPTLLEFAASIRQASELNDEFSVPMSTRILKNFIAQARSLNFEFAINSMLSNYPKMDGEREGIKMRFDADASQIADELGVVVGKYSTN